MEKNSLGEKFSQRKILQEKNSPRETFSMRKILIAKKTPKVQIMLLCLVKLRSSMKLP